MATMEELETRAKHVRSGELAALDALAAGMRELAVELPGESKLALDLAEGSQKLSTIVKLSARHDNAFGSWAELTISTFVTERMREAIARLEREEEA